jgi:SAM-dependent methyltransferase
VRRGFLANAHGYTSGVRQWDRVLALPVHALPSMRDRWSFGVMGLAARPGGRLLDIGCGVGDFLADMTHLGWDAEGVETDSQVIQVCRQRGLRVREGPLEHQHYPDDSFDAITAKHVIEHVHDPVAMLRECARILKPGGRVMMLTPNLRSLGHRVFGASWIGLDAPRHLVLFSAGSLRDAATTAGLDVVRLWSTARPSGFTWRVSAELRRAGRTTYAASRARSHRLMERAAERVVRLALLLNPEAGDELALLATKRPHAPGRAS